MSSQAIGLGKTAPKLLHDLYQFDPAKVIWGYNILTEPAPAWEEGRTARPVLHADRCKHNYLVKPNQSHLPALDERPSHASRWGVAAVCEKCRIHVLVLLDFPPASRAPCPNSDFPLHHFRTVKSVTANGLECHFQCTAEACQASLAVIYSPPTLNPKQLALLTNLDNLRRRQQDILREDPGRKDVELTQPIDALFRLKRYTDDSLNPTHTKRQFPAHNKKFLGAFGSDCHDFLRELGFKYAQADDGTYVWQLPDPGLTTDPLRPNPHRKFLENLSLELHLLINRMSIQDGSPKNPCERVAWVDARQHIERVLSAQGYDRRPGRILSPTEEDHPCFAALGALGDFSDPLVGFAYDRQSEDVANIPYYFDCLSQLAAGRQSEFLSIKVSTLASAGVVGRKELLAAYNDLGVTCDLSIAKDMDEDYLIGLYRTLGADSGPERQAHLKHSLRKIGESRNSRVMMSVASDTVETYDEALTFLGADHSMPDDSIEALYTMKTTESTDTMHIARRAVQLIADARNSAPLRSWLATGQFNAANEMDLDKACKHLQIQFDPSIDEQTLNYAIDLALADNPSERTREAVAAVQKAIKERKQYGEHSPETWPVGLESHGNTCYLNSLLQYYFTIKPLRDLVLNISQHQFDLTTHETKSERVQSIHLKRYEIEAYQKFASHLSVLFDKMIKAPGSKVRPDAELVCGAFLTPNGPDAVDKIGKEDEEATSMDANMSGMEPDPTASVENPSSADEMATSNGALSRRLSGASSATLIEEGDATSVPSTSVLPPSPPASPKAQIPEPQHAPPLPPRKPVEQPVDKPKTQLELAEDAAKRQQDVAEVMEDLLRRLRAAIKPQGEDAHGEQLDQLRDLFNMRFIETVISDNMATPKKEEDATNILLNVPYEATDIYSALDRVIDRRPEDVAGKQAEVFRTFTSLPPILQISVPRIAMQDGKAVKVNWRLQLEETIYMDRYCDSPEILSVRQKCWEIRKKLRMLQAEKDLISKTPNPGMTCPESLEATRQYLLDVQTTKNDLVELGMEPISTSDDIARDLEQEAGRLHARLRSITDEVTGLQEQLKGRFEVFTQHKYRLYAVFFHRGGSGGGHYWTDIYDFKNSMWRDYNDENVIQHTKPDEILNADPARDWKHGTPTYVVYVRDDIKDDYVEPLCRRPEEAIEEEAPPLIEGTQPDVHMTGDDNAKVPMDNGSIQSKGDWDSSGAYDKPSSGWRASGNITPKKRPNDGVLLERQDGRKTSEPTGSPRAKKPTIRIKATPYHVYQQSLAANLDELEQSSSALTSQNRSSQLKDTDGGMSADKA